MTVLEERGYFWWHDESIPTGCVAPESSVVGVLRIDEDGRVELELDGILSNKGHPFSVLSNDDDSIQGKCIQGILKGDRKIVLLTGLHRNGGHFSSNGISYERYLAINCLIGNQAFSPDAEALRFSSLEIDLKGFEEWLRLGAIDFTRTETEISAKYDKKEEIVYDLGDGRLSVRFDILWPYFGNHKRHTLTLNELSSLIYAPAEPCALEEMRTQFGLMEDLFILLTDSERCFDWPSLALLGDNKTYKYYFLRNKNSAPPPKSHECCTNFVQLRENFGQIFLAWKEKREFLGPAFYLYLGTRRGITLYTEHRFVNLIWGIEAFHRKKNPDAPASCRLVLKIQRILGQIVETKDKKWLAERLEHAHEPTLAQRIFEVFKDIRIGLDECRLRKFSDNCAKLRHGISHFGGQKQKGDYNEFIKELDQKNNAISYLYHALILKEIGIDETILNWWINQSFHSYSIKRAFVEAGLFDASVLTPPTDLRAQVGK